MKTRWELVWTVPAVAAMVVFFALGSSAATVPIDLITNNDASFSTSLSGNSVTFFTVMHNDLF